MHIWLRHSSSSYHFIVVVYEWSLSYHTYIYPTHQLLILLRRVVSCSILVHHITNPDIFSYTQMLYSLVPIPTYMQR